MPVEPRLLESIAARGWRAAEERRARRLAAVRLRRASPAASTAAGRSSLPDRPAAEAIAAVEAWYAARGLPPRFKIAGDLAEPSDLEARLADRGYAPGEATLTMVGSLAGAADRRIVIETSPGDAFRRVFADPDFGDDADARERLDALARMPSPRAFALISVDGTPAAIGACAVDGDWAGLIGMRTAPAHRRRGLARRVFLALGDFARRNGASRGYLQVEAQNAPAVALYRSAGFEAAYGYRYWRRG